MFVTKTMPIDKRLHQRDEKNSFFELVYDVVRLMPSGRVTSYGAVARYLGAARSARMVGWAMNASGKYLDIPAHRVVNKQGLLTGKAHFKGVPMEELLVGEGIEIIDNQIQNFEQIFWDPQKELSIE